MSVELEKLERLTEYFEPSEDEDNTNPSEALKCLYNIEDNVSCINDNKYDQEGIMSYIISNIKTVEQFLIKAQEQEKVIRIIMEKYVDIRALKHTSTYKEYNARMLDLNPTITTSKYFLTEDEFNLLKR